LRGSPVEVPKWEFHDFAGSRAILVDRKERLTTTIVENIRRFRAGENERQLNTSVFEVERESE
jgi:hypothetical protein